MENWDQSCCLPYHVRNLGDGGTTCSVLQRGERVIAGPWSSFQEVELRRMRRDQAFWGKGGGGRRGREEGREEEEPEGEGERGREREDGMDHGVLCSTQ